jgi:hypothetical protein
MGRLNPQQLAFKDAYCNPTSDTFGNAKRSALSVGFSPEYADVITAQGTEWFSEILRDVQMLRKAEKVLDSTLDLIPADEDGKTDVPVLKIQTDVAKFVAERIGKDRFSTRSELTGPDGGLLMKNPLDELSPEAREEMRLIYEKDMRNKLTTKE